MDSQKNVFAIRTLKDLFSLILSLSLTWYPFIKTIQGIELFGNYCIFAIKMQKHHSILA